MPHAACPVKCKAYFTRVRGEHHNLGGVISMHNDTSSQFFSSYGVK